MTNISKGDTHFNSLTDKTLYQSLKILMNTVKYVDEGHKAVNDAIAQVVIQTRKHLDPNPYSQFRQLETPLGRVAPGVLIEADEVEAHEENNVEWCDISELP